MEEELEIVEEVTEEPIEEIVEEDTEFNPDNLFNDDDAEEEVNYTFGEYDLSKFKDVLDFSDEELVSEFNEYASKYQEKGFTQEQVEFILDEKIAELEAQEDAKAKKPTQREVKEKLQKSLTKEEIRNYKPTSVFVRELVAGTEFEDKAMDIMQNPTLVKLFHTAYKKSLGKTTNINNTNKPKETQIKSMTIDEAYDLVIQATKDKGIDKESLIKDLKARVSDKEGLAHLLSLMGKK